MKKAHVKREMCLPGAVGLLKHRDKFGRVIVFSDLTKWDINVHSLKDIIMAAAMGCERFWHTPDVMNKGVILIENTKGFGVAHARQHSIQNTIRMRNVFMYSFPVGLKGIYYLNMPTLFSTVFKMLKSLFPKKLTSRMYMYPPNQTPTSLFEVAPPEILPTWAGGTLSIEEAAEDIKFYDEIINGTEG